MTEQRPWRRCGLAYRHLARREHVIVFGSAAA
jgi:hypothetical protein